MTFIDLTKNNLLFSALKNLISTVSKLSRNDNSLNTSLYNLHHLISEPNNVDGQELLNELLRTKEFVKTYDLSEYKDNKIKSLPSLFFNLNEEIQHAILSKKLISNSNLFKNINDFYKLSIGL